MSNVFSASLQVFQEEQGTLVHCGDPPAVGFICMTMYELRVLTEAAGATVDKVDREGRSHCPDGSG